jgi:ATP-dependent Clp protease adapter protein ClpS
MAEKNRKDEEQPKGAGAGNGGGEGSGGSSAGGAGKSGTATAKPKRAAKSAPKTKPPQMLPPWNVLLHNDDKNDLKHVVATIMELTTLKEQDAKLRTKEAHETGVALLLTTHKERAELYKDQFESKGLVVTIEPADK